MRGKVFCQIFVITENKCATSHKEIQICQKNNYRSGWKSMVAAKTQMKNASFKASAKKLHKWISKKNDKMKPFMPKLYFKVYVFLSKYDHMFHYMLASREFHQGTATQIHVTKSKETPRDLYFIWVKALL